MSLPKELKLRQARLAAMAEAKAKIAARAAQRYQREKAEFDEKIVNLNVLQEQQAKLGTATTLIADTGYCSDNNVKASQVRHFLHVSN